MVVAHQVPAHRRAHLGIAAAGHGEFVAVVKVRRARQRELQQLGQAALLFVGQHGGQALGVVVAQVDPALEHVVDAGIDDNAADRTRGVWRFHLTRGHGEDDLA